MPKIEPHELPEVVTYRDGLSGRALVKLPRQAIIDCSRPGAADDAVAHWVERVEFVGTPDDIRASLRESGAWSAGDLADDSANRERIVWVGACDIAETPADHC